MSIRDTILYYCLIIENMPLKGKVYSDNDGGRRLGMDSRRDEYMIDTIHDLYDTRSNTAIIRLCASFALKFAV